MAFFPTPFNMKGENIRATDFQRRRSLATFHGLRALVHLVPLLLTPPALLRLWAVRSGMPFFAAIVALVRFRTVILDMSLRTNIL